MRINHSGTIGYDSGLYDSVVEPGTEVWVLECEKQTGVIRPHYGRVAKVNQLADFASTLELDSGLVFDPRDSSYDAYIFASPIHAIRAWLRGIGCADLVADYDSSYTPWTHSRENIQWLP